MRARLRAGCRAYHPRPVVAESFRNGRAYDPARGAVTNSICPVQTFLCHAASRIIETLRIFQRPSEDPDSFPRADSAPSIPYPDRTSMIRVSPRNQCAHGRRPSTQAWPIAFTAAREYHLHR